MAEKLSVLAVRAADALNQVLRLQELLEIATEQGEEPLEKRSRRVELLLASYLCLVEPHIKEVELQLKKIQLSLLPAQEE